MGKMRAGDRRGRFRAQTLNPAAGSPWRRGEGHAPACTCTCTGGRMLNDQERERIEKRLLEERERALEAIGEFDREREQSLEDATGELTSYRFHPADLGTEAMEQEKQFLLASNEGRRLYAIDEALRRLYRTPEEFDRCE